MIQEGIARYQKREETLEYDGSIEEFLNVYERMGGRDERV